MISEKLSILATISREYSDKYVAKKCASNYTLLTLCIAVYAKQPLQAMYFKSLLYRGDRYYVLWCYASGESRRFATTREAFARFCATRYRDRWLMIISGRYEHLLRPFRSLYCNDESVISDYDSRRGRIIYIRSTGA